MEKETYMNVTETEADPEGTSCLDLEGPLLTHDPASLHLAVNI